MTSAQVVETSVTNNSSFQNYTDPDDHTIRTTDTPGFKPFTVLQLSSLYIPNIYINVLRRTFLKSLKVKLKLSKESAPSNEEQLIARIFFFCEPRSCS